MMRNELKTIIKKEYFDWIYSIGNTYIIYKKALLKK